MPTEVREYRAGVCILSLILGLLTDFIVQPVEGALEDLLYERVGNRLWPDKMVGEDAWAVA